MSPCTNPLLWKFSRIASASTAMHATISCDMSWLFWFHVSHRLGPSRSITIT